MIFLSDIQGTITAIVPDKIYQGSSNAKELILIAPFPSTSAVSAAIRLPNGQLLPPLVANSYMLSPLPAFSPAIFDRDGRNYHAWRMQLDAPLTAYSGDISVQFILSTNGGNGVIESTSECIINIGRGTPYITPSSSDGWQNVLNAIQALQQYVADNSEWDYVITPTEYASAPGTAFHEKVRNLLANASGRVLLKDLYSTEIGVINVPASVTYLKLINCSFGGELSGHVGCSVEGAAGAYANGTYNVLLLNNFGAVMHCKKASCLNCGGVENSHLYLCHNDENYTLPYHIISDTFFEDFNNEGVSPAILNLSEVAKITNIGFINGNATYREIKGASTVSGVWRTGDIPITYTNCLFVDGLSCQTYYTEEEQGQAILASDGVKRLLPVYSKEESDNKYVDKVSYASDLNSIDADIQSIRGGLGGANTAIAKNTQDISKNAEDIAANTAAIEDVRNSVSRVYKYVGSVASFNLLPASANIGDVYNVESEYTDPVGGVVYPAGTNFAWDGSKWDPLGGDFGEYSERLATAESDITTLEEKEEWDFVITKLEDFTTEKLATMSGRVLVKGVNHTVTYPEGVIIEVTLPSTIEVIRFIDCEMYANIIATESRRGTTIIGFVGNMYTPIDVAKLRNFYCVKDCAGYNEVINCFSVINSEIISATDCTFIQDAYCRFDDYLGGTGLSIFRNCTLINGVKIQSREFSVEGNEHNIEFNNCKHISNVHSVGNTNAIIDYVNCTFVDGDTCDGYYIAEDNGKVQTVNTDGSKSLISVYDKTEIDGMIGDISTALDELHTYAQSLVNGGATV